MNDLPPEARVSLNILSYFGYWVEVMIDFSTHNKTFIHIVIGRAERPIRLNRDLEPITAVLLRSQFSTYLPKVELWYFSIKETSKNS